MGGERHLCLLAAVSLLGPSGTQGDCWSPGLGDSVDEHTGRTEVTCESGVMSSGWIYNLGIESLCRGQVNILTWHIRKHLRREMCGLHSDLGVTSSL